MADGWRMRGTDTRTGSGGGRVGVCGLARHGMARVRGLRLARERCEIGLLWVEACRFVGIAAVDGRGWQRRERAGRRPFGRSAAVGSAAGLGVGVRVAGWWCDACAGGGTGASVGDSVCGAGAPACGCRWMVACVCAACTHPRSDFLFCRAISRGRARLLRGDGMRGGMRRGCCEDARVRVGHCGAGGVGGWLADAGSGYADRIGH